MPRKASDIDIEPEAPVAAEHDYRIAIAVLEAERDRVTIDSIYAHEQITRYQGTIHDAGTVDASRDRHIASIDDAIEMLRG